MDLYKSFEEQYKILSDRNIRVDTSTIKYLKKENYYKIVNGYGCFFKVDGMYVEDVQFKEMSLLLKFDREIKKIFYKNVMKIENIMRTHIAHVFECYHPQSNSYCDRCSYDDIAGDDIENSVKSLIGSLKSVVNKEKKKVDKLRLDAQNRGKANYMNITNRLVHFEEKYSNIPMWVLVNEITFGDLKNFYYSMKHRERNKICKNIGNDFREETLENIRINENDLKSFLDVFHLIRNEITHDGRMIGYRVKSWKIKKSKWNQ